MSRTIIHRMPRTFFGPSGDVGFARQDAGAISIEIYFSQGGLIGIAVLLVIVIMIYLIIREIRLMRTKPGNWSWNWNAISSRY